MNTEYGGPCRGSCLRKLPPKAAPESCLKSSPESYLDTIWHYVMSHRFQRLNKALACKTLHTPWCYQQLLNERKWAQANLVQVSSSTSGIVRQANGHTFIVDLITRTCTCGHFQENYIPCGHVFLHSNLVYQTILPLVTIFLNSFFHKPGKRHIFLIFLLSLLWKFHCRIKFLLQRKKEPAKSQAIYRRRAAKGKSGQSRKRRRKPSL